MPLIYIPVAQAINQPLALNSFVASTEDFAITELNEKELHRGTGGIWSCGLLEIIQLAYYKHDIVINHHELEHPYELSGYF
jgi:hypothetical protein